MKRLIKQGGEAFFGIVSSIIDPMDQAQRPEISACGGASANNEAIVNHVELDEEQLRSSQLRAPAEISRYERIADDFPDLFKEPSTMPQCHHIDMFSIKSSWKRERNQPSDR